MPRHLRVKQERKRVRYLGANWLVRSDRLAIPLASVTPRVACTIKRLVHRGLEIDAPNGLLLVPRPTKRAKRLAKLIIALSIATGMSLLFLPSFEQTAPIERLEECEFVTGSSLPKAAEELSRTELGGLSVLKVVCLGARHHVTIDGKELVVEAKKN